MASNWQRWMPFHIDRFRGSPDVQAMHPAARLGYLYLLASAWQTEDCTLSPDPQDLAAASGLGDELWNEYGPRITRKFTLIEGRLRNDVQYVEWLDSKRVFDKRRAGAERTNTTRSPNAERTQSERPAHTETHTQTSTETVKKEQVPLASTAGAVSAERGRLLGTLPCAGGCSYEVREDDLERDVGLFPGVEVEQEYRNMKAWLMASPKRQKTKSGIRKFMASWLTRAQDTPKHQVGGNSGKFAGKTESSLNAALQAIAVIRSRADREASGEAGSSPASEVGDGRLLGAGG
jgi:uncharacterized protein YdaU (DUF1376 family)